MDFWSAISKLSLKDKIVLLIGVIVIGAGVFGGAFWLLTRSPMLMFQFPESTLQSTNVTQMYRRGTYAGLPVLVRFPGTDYGVYVGGEELDINQYATSFQYNDLTIALAVKEGAYTDSEFFAYAMAPVFDGKDISDTNSYKSSVSDAGYLNTLYFYYEAGTLTTPSGEYYLVAYEYPIDGKNLIFMVATRKRSSTELIRAKDILDRMLYTLLIFSDGEIDDAVDIVPSSEQTAEEAGKVTVVDDSSSEKSSGSMISDVPDFLTDENLSKEDKLAILDKKTAEREYKASYPDAKDLEKQVEVTDELADKDVVFFILYTVSDSIPEEAYLFGPDGATYAPDYNNANGDGFVCWGMSNPPVGTYTIHLSANLRYGSYKADVLEKSVFKSLYGDVDEPIEHPSD